MCARTCVCVRERERRERERERVLDQGLPDLSVDAPAARPLMDLAVTLAVADRLVPDSFAAHAEALARS